MKLAIAFLTKDRVELSRQSIQPLLQPDKFDTFWIDGSVTDEGRTLPRSYAYVGVNSGVRGGAGAAIVFALSQLLASSKGYTHVALVENDVSLPADWLQSTLGLFDRGADDGLVVGAVSARCYADRVLFQRDGYAVCHNLGAGMVVFTRQAARLALSHFRSGWKTDNRRIFAQLSGVDIGPFWAFRNDDGPLVADWHWDATLAAHGLASLALTPSHVEMIGQDPPLEQQGLSIVKQPVTERIDNIGFQIYRERLQAVRDGRLRIETETETLFQYVPDVGWWYSPHQWHLLGARFSGDWRFRENRAFGEFAWVSGGISMEIGADTISHPTVTIPVSGLASLIVTGGKDGGRCEIVDESSGYKVTPTLPPEGATTQALQIPLPASIAWRVVRFTALTPGVTLIRLTCREAQPHDPTATFDHSTLPEPV